ncbi:MAG: 5'-nucleotidase C-terminal domain-containing protein [Bacteroidota bacterium]
MNKLIYFLLINGTLISFTCQRHQLPTQADTSSYRMDRGQVAPENHPTAMILAPYKNKLDEQMNIAIGTSAQRLYKQKPESPLGNWMADALQQQGKKISRKAISASIQNYGGIRIPEIPEGPVSLGKMYELMPFDNLLVIVEMTGTQVVQLFNHIAADGGWPVSSEIQFIINDQRAEKITIDRKVLLSDRKYYIAMPDYIANGGSDCDFLIGLPREDTGVLIRDLLIEEVKDLTAAGKNMEAKVTGRINWSDEVDE